jgi:type IV secretion system protein VirD4
MQNYGELRRTFLLGFVFSLILGSFFATIYANFQHGFNREVLDSFDLLAFWYETPFYTESPNPAFSRGLIIIAATAVVTPIALLIFLFGQVDHMGTARWARTHELAIAGYLRRYHKVTGPIFGKTTSPKFPGYYLTNGEQPHSLVVAPTRAGKGVGIVIPTLLTFNGSVLALDVKGELFELTSRARKARGDKVFKFAPFDPLGRSNSYNPVLDIVGMPSERQFSETRRLAVNLIEAKGKGAEGFIDGARDLFVAGILACIERGTPTIGAVYDLFNQPGEKYKLFAKLAEESKNKEAQRIFDNMAGNDSKILTSYTSVLGDGGLNLWADPLIKAATTTSDFSVYDLRRDPTAIFLCVSPNDLEVIAPLVRLFFQQIVSILQRSMPTKDEEFEVLFLLDEFKHLGKLEAIETAITTIAGYKGRFMFIIQSLSALTGAYEVSGKENFLSNTGVQVFMATADDETPTYISKSIGDYSYKAKSVSYTQGQIFDGNVQISEQGTQLLRPEQVRLIDESMQIVLIKGQPPLHLKKVKYYEDKILKRIFDGQTGELPEPEVLVIPDSEPVVSLDYVEERDAEEETTKSGVTIEGEDDEPLFIRDSEDDEVISETYASEFYDQDQVEDDYPETDEENDSPDEDEFLLDEQVRALSSQKELLEKIISIQKSGTYR